MFRVWYVNWRRYISILLCIHKYGTRRIVTGPGRAGLRLVELYMRRRSGDLYWSLFYFWFCLLECIGESYRWFYVNTIYIVWSFIINTLLQYLLVIWQTFYKLLLYLARKIIIANYSFEVYNFSFYRYLGILLCILLLFKIYLLYSTRFKNMTFPSSFHNHLIL